MLKSYYDYHAELCYRYFVNLDKDPEPEILHAHGFHDGVDYAFRDQDFGSGMDTLLFYFYPVLQERGERYWGYPWDIRDIAIRKDSGNVYIKSSKNHEIVDNGETIIDPSITNIPVVFFYGHHTQDMRVAAIRNIQWLTAAELGRFQAEPKPVHKKVSSKP